MPLYEYLCSKCGEKFEVIQKFSDTPLTVHEACGGTVERLISLSGFSLKGTGWYATDYARGGSSPKKDSDGDSSKIKTESKSTESKSGESKSSESKPTESKSSETKSETKPAATTTNKD